MVTLAFGYGVMFNFNFGILCAKSTFSFLHLVISRFLVAVFYSYSTQTSYPSTYVEETLIYLKLDAKYLGLSTFSTLEVIRKCVKPKSIATIPLSDTLEIISFCFNFTISSISIY